MGQVIVDRVDCANVTGRYHVDSRVEKASNAPISIGVDGGAPQVLGAARLARLDAPNTGHFSVPNPAPKDGRSHTLIVAGPSGGPASATSPPCSPSAAVVAATTPMATPAAEPMATTPSVDTLTAGAGPGANALRAGAGLGTIAAIGLAVWYFFLRKR